MNPNDVAAYLKDNPDFFENYADVVADVMIRIRMAAVRFPSASGRS